MKMRTIATLFGILALLSSPAALAQPDAAFDESVSSGMDEALLASSRAQTAMESVVSSVSKKEAATDAFVGFRDATQSAAAQCQEAFDAFGAAPSDGFTSADSALSAVEGALQALKDASDGVSLEAEASSDMDEAFEALLVAKVQLRAVLRAAPQP